MLWYNRSPARMNEKTPDKSLVTRPDLWKLGRLGPRVESSVACRPAWWMLHLRWEVDRRVLVSQTVSLSKILDCYPSCIFSQKLFRFLIQKIEVSEGLFFIRQENTPVKMDSQYKVGCVFAMVIWSEFRMWQYRDDGHREDENHFNEIAWKLPVNDNIR